jgi:hypothetical protein
MMKFMPYFWSVFIGAFLLWLWNKYTHINYSTGGSLDIISGAIIEFFMFTVLLQINNNRQLKAYKKELASHLTEIEKLLRKKG